MTSFGVGGSRAEGLEWEFRFDGKGFRVQGPD